jgi:hypothetical protein
MIPRGRGLLLNSRLERFPVVLAPAAPDSFVRCRTCSGMEAFEPGSAHMVRREARAIDIRGNAGLLRTGTLDPVCNHRA